MKRIVLAIIGVLWFVLLSLAGPPAANSSPLAVFSGTSTCVDFVKPLLKIPPDANCDRIKWKLVLFDGANGKQGAYKLTSEFGFHIDNSTYLTKGTNIVEGKWLTGRGAKSNPDAEVFQLSPDTHQSISFLKLGHNILHLLDRHGRLAVGDAAQSFTLSRLDKIVSPTESLSRRGAQIVSASSSVAGSTLGTFVGRSPCQEVAQQLTRVVAADCIKVKWQLVLYQDPVTLSPTTYQLKGTFFRDRIREGKWTILKGVRGNPNAVVYQIDLDNPRSSLFLFKADENILLFLDDDSNLMVGNADFSYTLNRVE